MKCERCHAEKRVTLHTVDDFNGYLCAECRDVWVRLETRIGFHGRQ